MALGLQCGLDRLGRAAFRGWWELKAYSCEHGVHLLLVYVVDLALKLGPAGEADLFCG
ncbi:hypothetical protein [Pseudomonas sp. UMAB-08]|uniref:hypothetical protein n=1 Tax=Pseudomonas sp. UMAB-08 TaxID=1365375 RepID=UPI001C56E4C6|nr:hypothetical protein [Pseudomonas sp. UMAB-08]